MVTELWAFFQKTAIRVLSHSVDMGIFYEAMTDIVKTVSKAN